MSCRRSSLVVVPAEARSPAFEAAVCVAHRALRYAVVSLFVVVNIMASGADVCKDTDSDNDENVKGQGTAGAGLGANAARTDGVTSASRLYLHS